MLCQDSLEKLPRTFSFVHLFLACPKRDIAGDVLRGHSGDESFLPITSIDFIFNHVKARIWIVTETTKLHVSCRFSLRFLATAIDSDFFCFYVVFGQIVNMQQHIYNGCLICSFHSDPSISLIYYTHSSPSRSCHSVSCARDCSSCSCCAGAATAKGAEKERRGG